MRLLSLARRSREGAGVVLLAGVESHAVETPPARATQEAPPAGRVRPRDQGEGCQKMGTMDSMERGERMVVGVVVGMQGGTWGFGCAGIIGEEWHTWGDHGWGLVRPQETRARLEKKGAVSVGESIPIFRRSTPGEWGGGRVGSEGRVESK